MINQKRNGLLKLSLIFILSSTIFDFINLPFGDLWLDIHLFLKDLMYIGFALLCYIQTPFKQLKLKTLLFMLIIWRVFIISINTIGLADNVYSLYFIYALYAVYTLYLARIFCMTTKLVKYTGSVTQRKANSYNVFIPVHSWRGVVKALILINVDPRYETTLLINNKDIYYVKNKYFHTTENRPEVLQRFVNKQEAMVSIKYISPKNLKEVKRLLHKRSITGVRDCQRLIIKG